jgi:hypothetical protein
MLRQAVFCAVHRQREIALPHEAIQLKWRRCAVRRACFLLGGPVIIVARSGNEPG